VQNKIIKILQKINNKLQKMHNLHRDNLYFMSKCVRLKYKISRKPYELKNITIFEKLIVFEN